MNTSTAVAERTEPEIQVPLTREERIARIKGGTEDIVAILEHDESTTRENARLTQLVARLEYDVEGMQRGVMQANEERDHFRELALERGAAIRAAAKPLFDSIKSDNERARNKSSSQRRRVGWFGRKVATVS